MDRMPGLAARVRKFSRACSGQSVIEWAMVFPLVFLLVVNVVNFGALAFACITISNAARAGAAYMQMGPNSAGAPQYPSQSAVQTVVQTDMSSLPNYTYATINVCSNYAGSPAADTPFTCLSPVDPATSNPYVDPESTSVMGTVEVTYRFCPLITGWTFPGLNISTTLPACTGAGNSLSGGTTITRVAAMRLM